MSGTLFFNKCRSGLIAFIEDKYAFLDGLKTRPETLKTILKEDHNGLESTTKQVITQRKIQCLFKDGLILVYTLEGNVRASKLFLHPDKEYTIVITRQGRQDWQHYYCKEVVEKRGGLLLKDAYVLDDTNWTPVGDRHVEFKEVIRCF